VSQGSAREEAAEIAEQPRSDAARNDGIREHDYPIPRWFNLAFAGTIVFALIYVPYYTFLSDWSAARQWEAEVARDHERFAAARAAAPTANPFRGNAAAIQEGQQVFATICAACHRPDASGLVGPSLVDPYWKYGHDDVELFTTVDKGRPAGMPGWGAQLGPDKIWKVLAYLETLPRSDEPGVGAPDYAPPAAPAAAPGAGG
jgi:cytochrome c oxidase cbb3-type subunit 3